MEHKCDMCGNVTQNDKYYELRAGFIGCFDCVDVFINKSLIINCAVCLKLKDNLIKWDHNEAICLDCLIDASSVFVRPLSKI